MLELGRVELLFLNSKVKRLLLEPIYWSLIPMGLILPLPEPNYSFNPVNEENEREDELEEGKTNERKICCS